MPPTATHTSESIQPHAAKRSAAIFSVVAASVITLLKILTGVLTGSLGMLSEAVHSSVDLIASAITLFSVQVADRPADDDHNYGHGKVESLTAFVETGIMFASCVWLVAEALHRIVFHHHLALKASFAPFIVLLCSIGVDFSRSRALARVAREHRSDALAADSVHFATDMWASFAVMLGLAATFAGERYHLPWLEYADPLAAIVVAGVILRVSWRLAKQTVDALLDATPTTDPTSNQPQSKDQLRNNLIHDLSAIPGVLSVDRLRTRRSGANYFADVTLGMPRNLTFQRTEQLTLAATEAVQRHLPGADVVVHTVPTASVAESIHDRIRAVAARRNLAIHEINVQQLDTGLHIEQHLEVDETMPLRQAHTLVTALEAEMRHEVPGIVSILTHIESEPATIEQPATIDSDRDLERRLRKVAATFPEILDIHDVFVTLRSSHTPSQGGVHLQVSCHCTLPDDLPMSSVHATITALEGAFKLEAPEVDRLLIHPEPATDNRR
ncbi:MAG TPA: cation diffusion facilitator family transporter [Acidobacteriaceae bacterium]|nr:cation diffusion facilitator family transporter [Acidobacteriaceae bacterium]